jgi:hypothetical protein
MSFEYVPTTPGAVNPATWKQRRATVRYRCPPATLGRLFIANSYQSLSAWVLNLSVNGAGLLLGDPLESGTWLLLELESLARDLTLEISARIVHATRQADGNWLLGCAFANRLSDDELDAVL